MFTEDLTSLRNKVIDYIKSVLEFRGTNYEIVSPDEYEDDISDEIYKLPRGIDISKHGHHVEYAIVIINIENGVLSFYGIEIGEMGDDKHFTEDELTTDTLVSIADIVLSLEK